MPEQIQPIVGKKSMTEQDKARIAAMKRNWEQRRKVGDNLGKIKTKIAVYSGKGGVGKTTIAVNLAVLLAQQGHSVGLLDADIDCPNVIRMLHMHSGPSSDDDGKIIPPEKHGVKVMSMGFFQKNELEAIIWRGPMIHNAINQFLELTAWGDLDYLVVDLPPGTSDAPLTIMQVLKLDGFRSRYHSSGPLIRRRGAFHQHDPQDEREHSGRRREHVWGNLRAGGR